MSSAGKASQAFEQSMEHGIALARAGASAGASHLRAFVIEASLLALFLAASLAIISSVFGGALSRGMAADELSVAVTLASGGAENGLEAFAADPAGAEGESVTYYEYRNGALYPVDGPGEGVYEVHRTVASDAREAGAVCVAKVFVVRDGEEVFTAESSSYVSGREG